MLHILESLAFSLQVAQGIVIHNMPSCLCSALDSKLYLCFEFFLISSNNDKMEHLLNHTGHNRECNTGSSLSSSFKVWRIVPACQSILIEQDSVPLVFIHSHSYTIKQGMSPNTNDLDFSLSIYKIEIMIPVLMVHFLKMKVDHRKLWKLKLLYK